MSRSLTSLPGRSLALATALAALTVPLSAQSVAASVLDWEAVGWVDGAASPQLFLNVDGSGVDISVSYTSNMWDGTPNVTANPDPAPVPPEQDGLLRFTNDRDPVVERTTVSILFSQPVLIDSVGMESISIIQNAFQEHVFIEAFDALDAPVLATSYTTSDPALVLLDVDGDATYETIGIGDQGSGEYGDAFVSYLATPVTRIDFSLEVTSPGGSELVAGFASTLITDAIFTVVPEPGSLSLALSGLLGLAIFGRSRGTASRS